MHVVICGGGVIGAATAYELSRRDIAVTIVERCQVGCAASGKSGGFLARDWCEGSPVAAMAERSFDLHAEWAERLGNPYGYRRVDTFAAGISARRKLAARPGDDAVAGWLSVDAVGRSQLGSMVTTAQLDPFAFTTALVEAAVANRAALVTGEVTGIAKSRDDSRVSGIELADGNSIACDALVLAMGPWSLLAARWLPLPPIYGLKGHSIIFRPDVPLPAEAIFAQYEDDDGEVFAPRSCHVPTGHSTSADCRGMRRCPLIRPASFRRLADVRNCVKSRSDWSPPWLAPKSSQSRPVIARLRRTACRSSAQFLASRRPMSRPGILSGEC